MDILINLGPVQFFLLLVGIFIGLNVVTLLFSSDSKRDEKFCLRREAFGRTNDKFSLKTCVSDFVELWVLFKRDEFGYWNNVNMNLRLLGSLLISYILTTMTVILDLTATGYPDENLSLFYVITIFGGIFTAVFYAERNSYYQKWSYLSGVYNERIKATPNDLGENGMFCYRDMLEVSLAVDVIKMEMWSHDSFNVFTRKQIELALRDFEKLNEEQISNKMKNITKNQAIQVLGLKQSAILKSYETKVFKNNNYFLVV